MRNRGKNLHAAGSKKSINMLKKIQSFKKRWKSFAVSKKEIKFLTVKKKFKFTYGKYLLNYKYKKKTYYCGQTHLRNK